MSVSLLFSLGAAVSVVIAVVLWFEVRRTRGALPRMVVTTGTVRELESILTDRRAGTVNSDTLVQVDFSVGGKAYCCRNLYLFSSNRHVGDVGKKFDFQPGQQVGVYYDPANPRRSALILDKPRHDTVILTLVVGAVSAIIAVFTAV